MWTRSAQNKITGKFRVTCTDYNGEVFYTAEFDSAADADRAGESAERRMTLAMQAATDDIGMTDDELLQELLS